MPYTKQPWTDNTTPVDAVHMNHIEDGLFTADANATTADGKATTALARALPTPVVNGQWVKGVGGAAVWSAITAADVSGLPGQELGYGETTANVTVNTTTQSAGQTIVTAPAVTVDGSTPIVVTFFAASVQVNTAAGGIILLDLWDGSTNIGNIGQFQTPGANPVIPWTTSRRFTPASGSHTYSVRGWLSGGATATVFNAGAGGPGVYPPVYLRVTRV